MSYNGWTNYETWLVNLWLDNDQGTYELMREMAQEVRETVTSPIEYTWETDGQAQIGELADRVQQFVDELMPDLSASMFADLLGAALSKVDWRKIADHYLEDCEDE